MAASVLRSRTVLILPMVLLTVALVEEVATYKVRQYVLDPPTRAAIVMTLNGAAFAIAANWISPWLKRMLSSARTTSRRGGGAVGLWLFYSVAYGALYYAFYVMEVSGPGGLLPASLR